VGDALLRADPSNLTIPGQGFPSGCKVINQSTEAVADERRSEVRYGLYNKIVASTNCEGHAMTGLGELLLASGNSECSDLTYVRAVCFKYAECGAVVADVVHGVRACLVE
jgi:hypothetical protein